jgi:hypothetical protein
MKCPNCGSPVSQFAAGCAICGEDLVAARAARERRRAAMPSLQGPAWFPEVTTADMVLGFLLTICAIAQPLVGGPIAGLFAYFAHKKGDVVQRNLALLATGFAVVIILLWSFDPESQQWLVTWSQVSNPFGTS